MFKITVDEDQISISLHRQMFVKTVLDGYPIFHDLGYSAPINQIPDDMNLVSLYRIAKAKGNLELKTIGLPTYNLMSQKQTGARYSCVMVVCRKTEIMYDTDSTEWFNYDSRRVRSTQEQIAERSIKPERRYRH